MLALLDKEVQFILLLHLLVFLPLLWIRTRSPQPLRLLLLIVQKPRMVSKDIDLLGPPHPRVLQPALQPAPLLLVIPWRAARIDEHDVVEHNVVAAIGPEGEVLVSVGGPEAFDGTGSGPIADVVVAAEADEGDGGVELAPEVLEV